MKRHFGYIKAGINGLLLLFLFLVPVSISADMNATDVSLLSLEQIEPLISDGPEVMAALSAVTRDESLAELERQRTGAKFFVGSTFGNSNEPAFDTSENQIGYNKLSLTGGLNFPLLGSLQKEEIGKIETETAVIKSKYHSDMLLLNNLVALRKAYTTLWIEQQKAKLAERFLSTETETTHILGQRRTEGLVLPTDRLELLSAYSDVKRDLAVSKLRQNQAMNTICLATGREWKESTKLKIPSLPDIDGKIIDFDIHPEVVFQHKLITQCEKLSKKKERTDREANLALGLTTTRDFPGSTGTGAYVAFSMTGPTKPSSAKELDKLAATNDLVKAKQEASLIRLKLAGQAEEALATVGPIAADINARAAHLIVMAESIREKTLRQMALPGDVFEQLERSKSQYYKTAVEMLDREEQYLDAAIVIVSYVYPSGLNSESRKRFFPINENNDAILNKLLAPNWLDAGIGQDISGPLDFSQIPNLKFPIVSIKVSEKVSINSPERNLTNSPERFAASSSSSEKISVFPLRKLEAMVYVWDAQPFLQSDTRDAEINALADAGFSRALISFTAEQLNDLLLPEGRAKLEALLHTAEIKGIRIDLLLGDPTWVEPAHRGELISLVKKFQSFKFSGIHLDIEPDSLANAAARRPELLDGLASTIKSVKNVSTLPVSISIHPRYLEGDLGVLARQKLLRLGLENVVVMMYSDNPDATAQRMSAIMASNPNVTFSLAQSVEKNIPEEESYAFKSWRQFSDAMHLLEDSLVNYGLKGICIEAWEDYKKGETQ